MLITDYNILMEGALPVCGYWQYLYARILAYNWYMHTCIHLIHAYMHTTDTYIHSYNWHIHTCIQLTHTYIRTSGTCILACIRMRNALRWYEDGTHACMYASWWLITCIHTWVHRYHTSMHTYIHTWNHTLHTYIQSICIIYIHPYKSHIHTYMHTYTTARQAHRVTAQPPSLVILPLRPRPARHLKRVRQRTTAKRASEFCLFRLQKARTLQYVFIFSMQGQILHPRNRCAQVERVELFVLCLLSYAENRCAQVKPFYATTCRIHQAGCHHDTRIHLRTCMIWWQMDGLNLRPSCERAM